MGLSKQSWQKHGAEPLQWGKRFAAELRESDESASDRSRRYVRISLWTITAIFAVLAAYWIKRMP
ncbi:hypothetical protein [Gorillibacterium timonense]|uniref:hypothetical protein n=1 Tax=Gorillibacterium timonense TaxID=1689269 RepID=UPI00071DB1A6|nr:hypothetical protein [Gorillibacterium timonense]